MAEQDKKDLPEELPAPLLQFPCEFPMKVVGQRTDDFAQQIVAITKNTLRTLTLRNRNESFQEKETISLWDFW